jgi:hypothetical protein
MDSAWQAASHGLIGGVRGAQAYFISAADGIVEGCKPIIDWKDDDAVVAGETNIGHIYETLLPGW